MPPIRLAEMYDFSQITSLNLTVQHHRCRREGTHYTLQTWLQKSITHSQWERP